MLQQRGNSVTFFLQFINGSVNFFTGERINRQPLHDFPAAILGGADREGADKTFFNAVGTVGANGHGIPVAFRSLGSQAAAESV